MHHLSDSEFHQVREDIYQGMKTYLGMYTGFGRLIRGFIRLQIPPDDMPSHFRVLYDVVPMTELLDRYGETMEALNTASTPSELLNELARLNEITEQLKRELGA